MNNLMKAPHASTAYTQMTQMNFCTLVTCNGMMSAADMAKIGQLCLNKGIWGGNRIISEEWITDMTRMYIHR